MRLMGPRPLGMRNAHRHHILETNGRPGEHRALVREGQDILQSYGIDPHQGTENLTWAPNTGHSLDNARPLVDELRMAQQAGAPRTDIVAILAYYGREAQRR